MPKSIYLINPIHDDFSYHGIEVFSDLGLPPAASHGDLVIATVAALVPEPFKVAICDENVSPANLDHPADFIGITGKISQFDRMVELAGEFQKRGKTVIIGGPLASLSPEKVRPYCDILVRGELEAISNRLFGDLEKGEWKEEYDGGRPGLENSPLPRWGLYPNNRAIIGSVQTSRGCPFGCDFCEVISYVGRKQRHKTANQVLKELDQLYHLGYRNIFIADDNFSADRPRCKELLLAIRGWNGSGKEGKIFFSTELSIDAAQDDNLVRLCREAGIIKVFVGIESPNKESLLQVGKNQNIEINMKESIQCFLNHDISVTAGMMIGFDSDGLDIFEWQYRFAMSLPIPVFTLTALHALPQTPVYKKLLKSNRLIPETEYEKSAAYWMTNFIPNQMTREELSSGIKWLALQLYNPDAFGKRVLGFIDNLKEYPREPGRNTEGRCKTGFRQVDLDVVNVIRHLPRLGPKEAKMFSAITRAVNKKPGASKHVMNMLFQYVQIRYMYKQYGLWRHNSQ